MAAPPPSDGHEATAIAFGIAAMDEYLEESTLEFPATRSAILDSLGNRPVPYDPRGQTISLEEALERTTREQFDSRRELLNALHPIFEDERNRGGIGGFLRSILPFGQRPPD